MKEQKDFSRMRTFLSGMAAALLLAAGVTAALAASGAVALSYNTVEIRFEGALTLEQGKNLETEYGASIPSTILYTDEQGRGTTYVPIRAVTEALDLETSWDAPKQILNVELTDAMALRYLPTNQAGTKWVGLMEELEPVAAPEKCKTLLDKDLTGTSEALSAELTGLAAKDGDQINITVSNHSDGPMKLELGVKRDADGFLFQTTQVSAHSTVTRTLRCASFEALNDQPVKFVLGNAEGVSRPFDAHVSVVQFQGAAE